MGLFALLQRQAPGAKWTASYLRACSAAKNADVQYIISTSVCDSETVAIMHVCWRYDCFGKKLAGKKLASTVVISCSDHLDISQKLRHKRHGPFCHDL
jgi:hypothetical protein